MFCRLFNTVINHGGVNYWTLLSAYNSIDQKMYRRLFYFAQDKIISHKIPCKTTRVSLYSDFISCEPHFKIV